MGIEPRELRMGMNLGARDDRRPGCIPADYFEARERFRQAASEAGARLESHPIAAPGPDGERLTIDAALLGDLGSTRMVVVSSGLHGVEGFIGSAIQTRFLSRWKPGDRDPPAVLMVHALNPYGFAHRRRVNEDNVDLNRNFLARFNGNGASRYALVDPLLNPPRPPSRAQDAWFLVQAARLIGRHGMSTLRQIVAEGQYRFPRGLFYGGSQVCDSTQTLMRQLPRWTGRAARVLHLDLHSGLGRPGTITMLAGDQHSAARIDRLQRLFPQARVARHDSSGGAYRASGTLGRWCEKRADGRRYRFLCVEFGTRGALQVLRALRCENQAHHWAAPGSAGWHRAKTRLLDSFCPFSPRWREAMLKAGHDLVVRATRQGDRYLREDDPDE